MAKKEINIEQFRAIIKEEAGKLNTRTLLEGEKEELQKEMEELGLVKEIEESKKIELTPEEFRSIVKEEAIKLKKRITLENEKKSLMKELDECGMGYSREEELGESKMEELFGLGGGGAEKKKAKLQQDFTTRAQQWRKKLDQPTLDALMSQAEADGFGGRVSHKDGVMAYQPSTAKEMGMTSKGSSAFGEAIEEGDLEEVNLGMIGRLFNHGGSFETAIAKSAQKLGIEPTEQEAAELLAQMKADGGQGQVVKSKTGRLFYKPSVVVAPHGAGNIAKWSE